MRRIFYLLAVTCILGCKVEKDLPGTYSPKNNQRTRLILKEDRTFELAVLDIGIDTMLFKNENRSHFFTTGQWAHTKKKLILKCQSNDTIEAKETFSDSITHFTNISSIHFWNRFGDPVPIRYIFLQPGKTKPHFGNSLFFFAQDFKPTDTLRFYFDGYPPFDFPGTVPAGIGNNMHRITLFEPYRSMDVEQREFGIRKQRLTNKKSKLSLLKRNH